jgi:hypothetical protein
LPATETRRKPIATRIDFNITRSRLFEMAMNRRPVTIIRTARFLEKFLSLSPQVETGRVTP